MNERFKGLFDPERSIPLFLLGTATVTLLIQVAYDYANEPGVWQGGYWLALLALLATTGSLIWSWRQRPGRIDIREKQQPRPRRGLILLAGPTKASNPAGLDHHLSSLTHCWILATPESAETAAALFGEYGRQVEIRFGPDYIVDAEEFEPAYAITRRILRQEAPEAGLGPTDIIADITGGTKPMTAGMAMACIACKTPMQYIKAQRDASGKVIWGAWGTPIQVDASFISLRGSDDSL